MVESTTKMTTENVPLWQILLYCDRGILTFAPSQQCKGRWMWRSRDTDESEIVVGLSVCLALPNDRMNES